MSTLPPTGENLEVTITPSPLRTYAAALLPVAVILIGAVQAALPGGVNSTEGGQLIALVAGLIATYLLPLTEGVWAGVLKTGAAILAAVATLVIPLVTGFTAESLLIFAVAALSALAVEIGVNIRRDDVALSA